MGQAITSYQDIHRISVEARKGYEANSQSKEVAAYENPNLYNYILASNLSEADKSPTRIANEAFELLIAGGNTLARITAAASYYLLCNLEYLQKLKEELGAAILDVDTIPPLRELEILPYLVRVITNDFPP